MDSSILTAVCAVILVPLVIALYLGATELIRFARRSTSRAARGVAWVLPATLLLALVAWYPAVGTLRKSFADSKGNGFVGWDNYKWALSGEQLGSLSRTLLWVLIVPAAAVILGLIVAVFSNGVNYQRVVRMIVLIPCAISMTAGSLTWFLIFAYRPGGDSQIGLLNAITTQFTGGEPVAWLIEDEFQIKNIALMLVGLWCWFGFAVVLLAAAVKAVPEEYIEAAKLDGANAFQIFWYITLRSIATTAVIAWVMIAAWAMKVFDIVYTLTGGDFGTSVLGTDMYEQLFIYRDVGKASALAVILLAIVLPIIVFNLVRIRRERLA